MELSQEFIFNINDISNDAEKLRLCLEDIQSVKRSVKSQKSRISNRPPIKGDKKSALDRLAAIQRANDKINYLKSEEAYVKRKLKEVRFFKAALNRATNAKNDRYREAFLAAAELTLDEEVFTQVEIKALEILDANKNTIRQGSQNG
jgi:hypothetical protein